jgi:hypothetical protein
LSQAIPPPSVPGVLGAILNRAGAVRITSAYRFGENPRGTRGFSFGVDSRESIGDDWGSPIRL